MDCVAFTAQVMIIYPDHCKLVGTTLTENIQQELKLSYNHATTKFLMDGNRWCCGQIEQGD